MLLNVEQIKSKNLSSECLSAACLKSQLRISIIFMCYYGIGIWCVVNKTFCCLDSNNIPVGHARHNTLGLGLQNSPKGAFAWSERKAQLSTEGSHTVEWLHFLKDTNNTTERKPWVRKTSHSCWPFRALCACSHTAL